MSRLISAPPVLFVRKSFLLVVFLLAAFLPGRLLAQAVAANFSLSVVTGGTTGDYGYYHITNFGGGNMLTMTFPIISQPAHGTAWSSGSIIYYTSVPGFTGVDSFTWKGVDGVVTSNTATCTVTVLANTIPTALNTSTTVTTGSTVAVPMNTSHPAADVDQTLTYHLLSQPAHGRLMFWKNISGTVSTINTAQYTANPGYSGTDSFLWSVDDGFGMSNTAQVGINVTALPRAPLSQTAIAVKNTPLTITPEVTDGVSVFTVSKTTNPAHGTLSTDGTLFTYTPASNYTGNDSFLWALTESGGTLTASATCSIVVKDSAGNVDWSQWRHDECRTAQTTMPLPAKLYLQWQRDIVPGPNAFEGCRGNYWPLDAVPDADFCRPVQMGKSLFVTSLGLDRISAFNTDTGAELWRYYASGVLRRPPAAATLAGGAKVVIFGSDDGFVYCLNADDGTERWRFQAAPNMKRAMAFARLASIWPVWGSPVIYNGKVYFVAGYLPSWMLYAYCLDADSGQVIWCNDGRMLENGFNSAFGPLTFSTDHSKIFGSTPGKSEAWVLSATSGELIGHTGYPVSYHDFRELAWRMDAAGNNYSFDDLTIVAGGRTVSSTELFAMGLPGRVSSILAGDGKLMVTNTSGQLFCFGPNNVTPTIYTTGTTPLSSGSDAWTGVVQSMLSRTDLKEGLALVWGVGSGRLVEELVQQSPDLMVVAADPDSSKLQALRRKMDDAGIPASRCSTLLGNPDQCGFAPNQAALIASEDVAAAGFADGIAMAKALYKATRPYGGEIWLATSNSQDAALAGWFSAAQFPTCGGAQSFQFTRRTFSGLPADGMTRIQRTGLPDACLTLKPPFRPLVFHRHDVVSLLASSAISGGTQSNTGYAAGDPVMGVKNGADIYTWLPRSTQGIGYEPPVPSYNDVNAALNTQPQSLYGPPKWNSMFGRTEQPYNIFFTWGSNCSGWFRYDNTALRPGKTMALFDAQNYWGVLIVPDIGSCGVPGYMGEGVAAASASNACTCNHDLAYTQLGLIATDDPTDEMWYHSRMKPTMAPVNDARIRHAAINFGAPGDRIDPVRDAIWTHHPMTGHRGEATPQIAVSYQGPVKARFHDAAQLPAETGTRGWISPGSVAGMTRITVPLSSPLVATQTPSAPTLDGALNDSCWAGQTKIRIQRYAPPGANEVIAPDDGCYAMLRYDANNLYVAGGMHALKNATSQYNRKRYMRVALNNRDLQTQPVILFFGELGKSSQAIASGSWQSAYLTGTTGETFTGEASIPWSVLQDAGLWKDQLVMNIQVCGCVVNGDFDEDGDSVTLTSGNMFKYLSPLYLDAARGVVTENQSHTVRLFFTEMEASGTGQRVFDVKLQGQTVLSNFDPFAEAGHRGREVVKEFTNIALADHLDIDFVAQKGDPMLSGVEILNTGTFAGTNQSPVALMDASVTSGTAPLSVTFSGRRSYDPDGQILECAWETGDGRLVRSSTFNHVFAEPGTYRVNLLVLDSRGGTCTTGTTITVATGAPSSFICTIRASGGDYTTISAWNNAIASDLTSSAVIFPVTNKLTYASSDDGAALTFSGGGTGTLQWLDTNRNIVAVSGTSGTITTGTVTISTGHKFIMSSTGSTSRNLLFPVLSRGSYTTGCDGLPVTFSGGGQGTLRHVNGSNLAYIAGCTGTILSGSLQVTSASGTFSVTGPGSPIYTAVAECYNDWSGGLSDGPTLTGTNGWVADESHCVVIRPGPGQGHNGALKIGSAYSGFAISGYKTLSTSGLPYTRIERIIMPSTSSMTVGNCNSVNRVLSSVTLSGTNVVVANSVGTSFKDTTGGNGNPASFYNCTGGSFTLASSVKYKVRAVNCLAYTSGTGFLSYNATGSQDWYDPSREYWLSRCVSVGTGATGCDSWREGNEGNQANQVVTFADAANGNYKLTVSDSGAVGKGQPGLGADVTGAARLGPTYDVGAFQTSGSGKPFLFSGSVTSPGTVSLQWSCSLSSGETGYRVEVSTNGGASYDTLSDSLPLNPTTLLTSQIPITSSTQLYRVTAFGPGGDTMQSSAVALVPFTPLQAWLAANGLPADGSGDGALGACPAKDGITTLMKYALGIDPNKQGYQGRLSNGKTSVSGSDYLSLTYTIPEPPPAEVTYTPEASTDLSSGNWSSSGLVVVSSTVSGNLRTVTVRDNTAVGSNARRFIHLKISVP